MASSKPTVLNSLHLPGSPGSTRVVVAMSGGVDSSVVAALLKAEGYDVVGITLQLYDHGEALGRKGSCCAGQDIQDARRVADTLKIPHYVLDYEQRFAKAVMGAFADSYLQARNYYLMALASLTTWRSTGFLAPSAFCKLGAHLALGPLDAHRHSRLKKPLPRV